MACKHCHKVGLKRPVKFVQGRVYVYHNGYSKERYILAQVLAKKFCLVSLQSGNRFNDPTADLDQIAYPYDERFQEDSNGN